MPSAPLQEEGLSSDQAMEEEQSEMLKMQNFEKNSTIYLQFYEQNLIMNTKLCLTFEQDQKQIFCDTLKQARCQFKCDEGFSEQIEKLAEFNIRVRSMSLTEIQKEVLMAKIARLPKGLLGKLERLFQICIEKLQARNASKQTELDKSAHLESVLQKKFQELAERIRYCKMYMEDYEIDFLFSRDQVKKVNKANQVLNKNNEAAAQIEDLRVRNERLNQQNQDLKAQNQSEKPRLESQIGKLEQANLDYNTQIESLKAQIKVQNETEPDQMKLKVLNLEKTLEALIEDHMAQKEVQKQINLDCQAQIEGLKVQNGVEIVHLKSEIRKSVEAQNQFNLNCDAQMKSLKAQMEAQNSALQAQKQDYTAQTEGLKAHISAENKSKVAYKAQVESLTAQNEELKREMKELRLSVALMSTMMQGDKKKFQQSLEEELAKIKLAEQEQLESNQQLQKDEVNKPKRHETKEEKQWFRAMRQQDILTMRRLLKENPEILEARDQQLEMTALLWATDLGQDDVVQFLIDQKADVNAVDNRGQTPLHFAAQCCRPHLAKILVQAGADKSAQDADGLTPAQCCCGDENFQRN